MLSLSSGSEDVQRFRAVMAPLEGLPTIQKFVLAYANLTPDGKRLTEAPAVLEAVMFAIWLEACAKLDVRPSDPNLTTNGQPL